MGLYTRFRALWQDGSAGGTPVTAAALNYIEDGIVAASDHGTLAGLLDDDHTQYLLRTDASAAYLAKALADAKGDLIGATGPDAFARLPVGANGLVLVADSAAPLGVKWAAAGGLAVIAETALSATAASITFSSIPATYRHLRLVVHGRATSGLTTDSLNIRLNGDAALNYNEQLLRGSGTAVTADAGAGKTALLIGQIAAANASPSRAGVVDVLFPDYATTAFHKLALADSITFESDNTGLFYRDAKGGLWRSTAAINAMSIFPQSGSLAAGTVATLYGLKGAT